MNGNTTTFTMDLNMGLTQALSDGTDTYIYGLGRIAQVNTSTEYFLGDALGSVRQLTDATGTISYARAYDPYGVVTATTGTAQTSYGYTSEYNGDYNELVYLRARYYAPGMGRFLTRDTWAGNANSPMSFNMWSYVMGNPINYIDPTGNVSEKQADTANKIVEDLQKQLVKIEVDWGYQHSPYIPHNLQENLSGCYWEKGLWTLEELKIVKFAVDRQNIKMGGKFSLIMGPSVIAKKIGTCVGARACTYGNHIDLQDRGKLPYPGYRPERTPLDSHVNFDAWSVVHEFGHVWNNNRGKQLEIGLEDYTGGYTWPYEKPYGCDKDARLPGCNKAGYFYFGIPAYGASLSFTRSEDFSNSWAAYVFPDEAQARIFDLYGDSRNRYFKYLYYPDFRQTSRWAYVNSLLNAYYGR